MLPEFVNAIITLNTTGSYELYSGETQSGGQTTVTIEANTAEGYGSRYYKIKQVVVEPGQQAYIQKFDLPNLDLVHKLMLMSIEENIHGIGRSTIQLNEKSTGSNSKDQHDNINSTIPIVKTQPKFTNHIISEEPIRAEEIQSTSSNNVFSGSEYPGGIDDDLESFMGSGIKIANMRTNPIANGQAANKHRSSIESFLNDSF